MSETSERQIKTPKGKVGTKGSGVLDYPGPTMEELRQWLGLDKPKLPKPKDPFDMLNRDYR